MILSRTQCAILANAYEIEEARVKQDASIVRDWGGTEAELMEVFEGRHRWTVASEYASSYVGALRQALHAAR